jgi:protein-tyrosine-phosphatase
MTLAGSAHRSILFVCAGNTCRSVMAAALARKRFYDAVRIDSAGVRPGVAAGASMAVETLQREFGIDASGHQPKPMKDVDLEGFSQVIALDEAIACALRAVTAREILTWDVRDPWGEGPAAYMCCARTIEELVAQL